MGRPPQEKRSTAIGQLFTDARLWKGWTATEAARQVGCSHAQFHNWELGYSTPSSRRLWRLQQVLGLDAGLLLLALHFAPKANTYRRGMPT